MKRLMMSNGSRGIAKISPEYKTWQLGVIVWKSNPPKDLFAKSWTNGSKFSRKRAKWGMGAF